MRNIFIPLLLPFILLVSCNRQPEQAVPISGGPEKKKEISIHRYEKALFTLPDGALRQGLDKIYPEFSFFLGKDWSDTINLLRVHNFISDPNIRELYEHVNKRFPDTDFLKQGLNQIFTGLGENFPDLVVPEVYTYVSGLDVEVPVLYADTAMAIALDLFLGKDDPVYAKAGIPIYMSERFTGEELLPSCVRSIADSLIKPDPTKQSLLDQMVKAGKVLYLMDKVLPDMSDENKIGYTPEKLEWCRKNEGNIWSFLVANQLLFSSDPRVSGRLMTDAPFTSGFDHSSPGRIGEWAGWQIVRAYMKNNSGVTLSELMKNNNSQTILEGSHYKPGK